MNLELSKEELLEVLHSALCNGGLIELSHVGVDLNVCPILYKNASDRLKKAGQESICFEDVLVEVLNDGKDLEFYDCEGDEAQSFNLEQAKENLKKEEFAKDVLATVNQEDDAWTGWNILQGALYGEVIYA